MAKSALHQAVAIREGRLAAPAEGNWPEEHWRLYRSGGVLAWTIPQRSGGSERPTDDVLAACIELARDQLVSTFVLSQFQSACSRFVASGNERLKAIWLPALANGDAFSTVGISHLTTSRQHVDKPVVLAEVDGHRFRVTGEIPWVTSGSRADVLVAGAALADGQQILFAVPGRRAGVETADPWPLLALTGSETGTVRLRDVEITENDLLFGPVHQVLLQGSPGGAGSLTTSALSLGHAFHCVEQIGQEAAARPALAEIVAAFERDLEPLRAELLAAAAGRGGPEQTPETLRTRSTALALSTSQALMAVSKGAGFVAGHPAERLAREAMFFLVWSCPQAVSNRLLREFSQCEFAN